MTYPPNTCACGQTIWYNSTRCRQCAGRERRGVLHPRFWTPAQDDALELAYSQGVRVETLAAQWGRSARAIQNRAWGLGLVRPKKASHPIDKS